MFEIDKKVRQAMLDRLERPDGPAELQARLGVLDRQVEQMLGGADLLDGEQCRTHVQRMLDHALRLGRVGHQPGRCIRETDRGLRTGQVECHQRGAVHAFSCGVDGVQRQPVRPVRGDEQVIGHTRRRPARPFR